MLDYILAILRTVEAFGAFKSLFIGLIVTIGIILIAFAGLQLGKPFLERIHYELVNLKDETRTKIG